MSELKKSQTDMQSLISATLQEIERKNSVTVLFAAESGSRTWGFPSPDSDFDIRFIYCHPKDWYLSLRKRDDTIDFFADHEQDLTGWDIRKALLLSKGANVSPMEWVNSAIVYKEKPGFRSAFKQAIRPWFSPVSATFHYLGIARRYFERISDTDELKLKDLFYALRTVMNCLWIIKHGTFPPLYFPETLAEVADERLQTKVNELMEMKMGQEEGYRHRAEQELIGWIGGQIRHIEDVAKDLPSANADATELDEFFIKTIRKFG